MKEQDDLTPMGKRIDAGMKFRGWNKSRTAREAGMDPATLSRWLYEPQKRIDECKLRRLSKALGFDSVWLRTGVGSPTPRLELTPNEHRLVLLLRALPPADRAKLIERAQLLVDVSPTV